MSEIIKEPTIFDGRIHPTDIQQGFLGDCYLLAGIAAIAERPDRIFKLFLIKKKNSCNYYSVKILFKGKWRIIDLDEFIPTLYSKLVFGKSIKEKEIWVSLLEKAWAKIYGSYRQIESGFA